MALQMDFTDDAGTAHTAAHWRVVQINISAADRNINLIFYAYRDLQAFGTGKAPLVGGSKQYSIIGDEFLEIAGAPPNGAIMYDALANATEDYAVGKKDVDTGQRDQQDNPIMVSFFANATKV